MSRLRTRAPIVLAAMLAGASAWPLARGAREPAQWLAGPPAARWPPRTHVAVWIAASPVRKDDPAFVERAMRVWTQAAAGQFTLDKIGVENAAQIRIRFGAGEDLLGETTPVVDPRTG